MQRALILLGLLLSVGLRADVCALPGTIDFFPLNGSSLGICDNNSLTVEGGNYVLCSPCGPAVQLQGASSDLFSSSLAAALSNLSVYTIQMDVSATYGGSNPYPTMELFHADEPGYGSVLIMETYSEGEVDFWDNLGFGSILADVNLSMGTCVNISMVSDGQALYLYFNGELVGGPVACNTTLPALDSVGFSACCDEPATVADFSNIYVSSQVQGAPVVPPAGCAPSPMPTATMTPSPSPTATPTPTPACQTCSNGLAPIYQGILPNSSTDEPWASVNLDHTTGTTKTIGYKGCFLTCFSMIDPNHETPAELNTLFTKDGDINSVGSLWNYQPAANLIGFNCSSLPVTGVDAENLISGNVCLPNTYVVVGLSPSHYVLVTGEEYDHATQDCRFTIDDPAGSRNYTYLDQYTDGSRTIANVEIFKVR